MKKIKIKIKDQVAQEKRCRQKSVEAVREEEVKLSETTVRGPSRSVRNAAVEQTHFWSHVFVRFVSVT